MPDTTGLSQLTNAGKAVIPGYTLSSPTLLDIGAAEEDFAQQFLGRVSAAARKLPATDREQMIKIAVSEIRLNSMSYGTEAFDSWALDPSQLPLLVYLSLRVKHPDVTREQAAEMLAKNERAITSAVLDLWGYDVGKKAFAPRASSEVSPGATSSDTSPATDEATQKSAP